jgi:hypothetical protein
LPYLTTSFKPFPGKRQKNDYVSMKRAREGCYLTYSVFLKSYSKKVVEPVARPRLSGRRRYEKAHGAIDTSFWLIPAIPIKPGHG